MKTELNSTYLLFEAHPLIPVFYSNDVILACQIVRACYEGGIRVFEFINRGEKARYVFSVLRSFTDTNFPEMALGVGTIFDKEQAKYFISAGADFIVQPIITQEVAQYCKSENIAWIPGASTLNEIHQAVLLGAEVIKIFPANVVGADFIRALRVPMPNLKIMVTGGVNPTKEGLREWFEAGATCVGIGSQLFQNQEFNAERLNNSISTLVGYIKTLKK
jgi:2-dehydro-3-deoxyphosphogluconate aldolase/(4S)-4-hydroxy-2-oxoglutarate aldolase